MEEEPVLKVLAIVFGFLCPLTCFSLCLAPFVYLSFKWSAETGKTYQLLMKKWADENGWEIVRQRHREFGSPWMFSTSGFQFIYYVALARKEDLMRVRWAWVRCGGWLSGPKSDRIDVHWDGKWQVLPPPEPEPPPIAPQDHLLWDPRLDS
jgi:hypothetical protein